MWTDVVDLKTFYDSNLGNMAFSLIQRQVRSMWPNLKGEHLVGLGYPTPYLNDFLNDANRVTAAMPAALGAITWPSEKPSLTTLVENLDLPFSDLSVDKY